MTAERESRILESGRRAVDAPADAVLADRVTGTDATALALTDDPGGASGGGSGARAQRVPVPPPWPAKLDPRFQPAPADHPLSGAFAVFRKLDAFKNVPIVLVDCSDAGTRLFVAQHEDRQAFIASAGKVMILFAAFQLRAAFRQAVATLTVDREADVFATIARAWQGPIARFYLPGKDVDNSQPVLSRIFTVHRTGDRWTADFRSTPAGGGPPEFLDHLRESVFWSQNAGSAACIRMLGFPFIHGVMREAGLWKNGRGLWLSANFDFHDWDPVAAAEHRYSSSAATARTLAALHTLLLFDELVPGAGAEMRGLMAGLSRGSQVGLGSLLADGALRRTAVSTAHKATVEARGKLGYLDEGTNNHAEGVAIERDSSVGHIRYVAAALTVRDRDLIIRLGGALDACITVSRGEQPPP